MRRKKYFKCLLLLIFISFVMIAIGDTINAPKPIYKMLHILNMMPIIGITTARLYDSGMNIEKSIATTLVFYIGIIITVWTNDIAIYIITILYALVLIGLTFRKTKRIQNVW